MNHYIALILADREKTEKDKQAALDLAAAPFDKKLKEADEALKALGYNPSETYRAPKVLFPNISVNLDSPTIKQRVTSALTEQYPEGAHYSAILDYINDKWPHLKVERTSLSPQLTRLRKQLVIDLDEKSGIWRLVTNQTEPKKNEAPHGASGEAWQGLA